MSGRETAAGLFAGLRHVGRALPIGFVLLGGIVACGTPIVTVSRDTSNHRGRLAVPAPVTIQVSHDGYAAHAEPYVAVNPRHPSNLLGAAQIFRSSTSLPRAGTFASFNGGRTWARQGPLPVPSNRPVAQDTTVAFDARGMGFVAAMTAPVVGGRPADITSIVIWRTDNGGRSFHRPVILARGRRLDHPWLTAAPGGKVLYLVWNDHIRNTLLLSRSTDGGRSFSGGHTIYRGGLLSDPVVTAGAGGRVSVAFYHSPDGRRFSIGVVTSSNQGRSFSAFRIVPQTLRDRLLYAGRSEPSSRLGAAIDARTGMLSVVYAAYGGVGHTDVLLSRSPDGGPNWLSPVRVDHTPAGDHVINQQPQIAVGRGGRVYVSYLSQRGFHMDLYLAGSTSQGAGFQRTIRVTSRSFDPSLGIKTFRPGSWWIGDYQGLACGPGTVYPFWNDTHTGRLEIFTAMVRESALRVSEDSTGRSS